MRRGSSSSISIKVYIYLELVCDSKWILKEDADVMCEQIMGDAKKDDANSIGLWWCTQYY